MYVVCALEAERCSFQAPIQLEKEKRVKEKKEERDRRWE